MVLRTATKEQIPASTPRAIQLWRDLPALSRYIGHVVLLLLVFLASRTLIPRDLPALALENQLEVQVVATPSASATSETTLAADAVTTETVASSETSGDTEYLTRSSEPVTLRGMRDVLALSVPQRSVRTSVLTYRVQSGDTVLGIAEKFGLDGNSILWANDDLYNNPDFLQIDQEIYILPVDGAYHTVAAGETLESIATRYKVDASVIYEYSANQLESPYTLNEGQKLIIPGGTKPYTPRVVQAYNGSVPTDARKGTGQFAWPINGTISQTFWEGHPAIDIAAPTGTQIVASDSGFVITVQYSNTGYGRMVVIDHGNGYKTLYAHMSVIYVEVGQSVSRGEVIGLSGSTGNSTGPHLHFEIIKNDARRNPLNYLP